MDPAALRASFPVLARRAYLNAGTCGPLPAAAARAAIETIEQAAEEGRSGPYFEGLPELRARLRDGYAQLLGAAPDDVALTTCTSECMVRVLAALALGPGDEVLTSTEEHPGLLGPLAAARAQRGMIRDLPGRDLLRASVGAWNDESTSSGPSSGPEASRGGRAARVAGRLQRAAALVAPVWVTPEPA
ncbi:MAG: L-cysteine/cystine lyase [Solirubrobacteraceae bacterium]|nr:L-cysteine/cystine lyase [Solirubrobacteraceae bacterium]